MPGKIVALQWEGPPIVEIVRADVAAGRSPRYLYKFRPGLPNEFTEKIFRDTELWYSSPADFNDPFDCFIELDTNNTLEEIEDFIRKNPDNQGIDEQRIKQQALAWFNDPEHFHKLINNTSYEALNSCGIGCFAPDADEVLMWSHYAASHTGICLKFDVLADPEGFALIFKVEYPKEYPSWNHIRNAVGQTVAQLVSHKSQRWDYEREWRVLKFGMTGSHSFKREALVEVIFGCKASNDSIAKTKTVLLESGMSQVPLKQAHRARGSYALTFESI